MEGARELAWAVSRPGTSPEEGRGEFDRLVGELEREWQIMFPRGLGYRTLEVRSPSGERVQLEASRGDFVARLDLSRDHARSSSVIRAVASAESRMLLAARSVGRATQAWTSRLATLGGALLALLVCWSTIGVQSAPLIVGLMLATILGTLLIGGHTLGVRVGEELARTFEAQALRRVSEDPGRPGDLARWHSLARQLRTYRRALARGFTGTPFRRSA